MSNGWLIMAGFAAAISLLFGFISLFGVQLRLRQEAGSPPVQTASPAATPTPTPPPTEVELLPGSSEPQKIVSESMTIEPKSYRSYPFEVTETNGTARLSGEVTASGGGKDDIYLLVLDDPGLEDYRAGRGFGSYFQTRLTDTRKISISLQPGSYHIVFSNTHARFYPKRVRADLILSYE